MIKIRLPQSDKALIWEVKYRTWDPNDNVAKDDIFIIKMVIDT